MTILDRRRTLLELLGIATGWSCFHSRVQGRNQAGKTPDFTAVHGIMAKILEDCQVAGGSLAVAYRGRLVLTRGYGLADVDKRRPVTRDTLFCIASVTKPITALGVLKLVEDGKVDLDSPLVKVLSDLKPLPGKKIADARFNDITVRHLLYHASGLTRNGRGPSAGDTEDEEDGDTQETLVYRAMMSKPLEFAPGSETRYSNLGFIVLRLVIEKAAGEGYEKYVREKILAPMGIKRMHLEKKGDYEADETRRYQAGGRKPAARIVANWLSPSMALVKFVSAVAGSGGKTFLSKKTTEEMLSLPPPPAYKRGHSGAHMGLGWDAVQKFPKGYRFSKNGGKPGVQAWLQHLEDGIDWAVLFNTSPIAPDRSALVAARRQLPGAFREALGLPTGK